MNTFREYNLNIKKNFISMPMCECGCGGKCKVTLNSVEDIAGFCSKTLMETDSYPSAIFADGEKGKYVVLKHIGKHYPSNRNITEEELYVFDPLYKYDSVVTEEGKLYGVTIDCVEYPKDADNLFARYEKEFRLDSYGVIVEEKPGVWGAIEA